MLHKLLQSFAAVLLCALTSFAHAQSSCRQPTPIEAALFVSPVTSPGIVSPKDGTCFLKNIDVPTHDGLKLKANVFLPAGTGTAQKFPGVLFISSWASADFFEYLGQQHVLARDGYVAVAYTTRGFWLSQGEVAVASPDDVRDVSSTLDWMAANTPADMGRVGASGISYGAGIGLLALGVEPRLRTAVALSGWGSLVDELYPDEVPNKHWINILATAGQITGRMDATTLEYVAAIQNPDTPPARINEMREWGRVRSPSDAVDRINARGTPVFISKNFQDELFTPNSSMALFARLTVPRKLLLNPGIHASAELPGAIVGAPNFVFDQAHRWLNRWLKSEANGIENEPEVSMQIKFSKERDNFATWPAPELREITSYLSPRGALRWDLSCFCYKGVRGGLGAAPSTGTASDTIQNFADTTAAASPVPVASALGEGFGLPVINHLATVMRANGVVYQGAALPASMKIRGIPKLQLRVRPSQARALVVAYLYDVDAAGFGTLITHGTRAVHAAMPNATIDFPIDFVATAYDVKAGHHVAVVLDTADNLFSPPVNKGEAFSVSFDFSPGAQSTLVLPVR